MSTRRGESSLSLLLLSVKHKMLSKHAVGRHLNKQQLIADFIETLRLQEKYQHLLFHGWQTE